DVALVAHRVEVVLAVLALVLAQERDDLVDFVLYGAVGPNQPLVRVREKCGKVRPRLAQMEEDRAASDERFVIAGELLGRVMRDLSQQLPLTTYPLQERLGRRRVVGQGRCGHASFSIVRTLASRERALTVEDRPIFRRCRSCAGP